MLLSILNILEPEPQMAMLLAEKKRDKSHCVDQNDWLYKVRSLPFIEFLGHLGAAHHNLIPYKSNINFLNVLKVFLALH